MDEHAWQGIQVAIENAFDARVQVAQIYTGGLSGAPVVLANFMPTRTSPLSGFHVVKFGKQGWATKEAKFYHDHQDGPLSSLLRSRLVRHKDDMHGRDWSSAAVYTTAFEEVPRIRTLADTVTQALNKRADGVPDGVVRQIERVVQILLRWNALDKRDDARTPKGADPWSLLDMMLTPRRADLLARLRECLPQWPQGDTVIGIREPAEAQAHQLPNALAYFTRAAWKDVNVRPPYPPGRAHGDLHAGNVLLLPDTDTDPALIDWADYNDASLPFYDLAYLEYDLAQRALPPTSPENREQWWELISTLMCHHLQVNPLRDLQGGRLGKAWALVQPIRRLAEAACQVDGKSWEDFYKALWWLAVVAVGLNFARKGRHLRNPLERAAALLYAGRGLECVFESFGMSKPEPSRQALVYWKSGRLPEHDGQRPDDRRVILGREAEISLATEQLNRHSPVTVIEGAPGIGKGEFAKVLARRCREGSLDGLQTPFDVVVEIGPGLKFPPDQTWRAFVAHVARELDLRVGSSIKDNVRRITSLLRSRRALFVVDNAVALHDQNVLNLLCHTPEECMVMIVTSRRGQIRESGDVEPRRIKLGALSRECVCEFSQAYARGLGDMHGLPLNDDELARLADVTGGNPKAIKRIVKLAYDPGMTLHRVLDRFEEDDPRQGAAPQSDDGVADALKDLFEAQWRTLSPQAQRTLLALSLFRHMVTQEAIRAVSDLGDHDLNAALNELTNAWLVDLLPNQRGESPRYILAPLVRAFARMKEADVTEWQPNEARSRWHGYYEHLSSGIVRSTADADEPARDDLIPVSRQLERDKRLVPEARNICGVADWLLNQGDMANLAIVLRRTQNVLFAEGHWDRLVVYAERVAPWAGTQSNATVLRDMLRAAVDIYAYRADYPQGIRLLNLFRRQLKLHDRPELEVDLSLAIGRLYSRHALHNGHPDPAVAAQVKQAPVTMSSAAQQFCELTQWERAVDAYWALGSHYLDTGAANRAKEIFGNMNTLLRQNPTSVDAVYWDPLITLGLSRAQLLRPKNDHECWQARMLLEATKGDLVGIYHRLTARLALALTDMRKGDGDISSARACCEEVATWKQHLRIAGYLCHEERLLGEHLPAGVLRTPVIGG